MPFWKRENQCLKVNDIVTLDDISGEIIRCAIEVHKILGPGLLESAYSECLEYELKESGLFVEREKPVSIIYKEIYVERGYRIDLLVEERVVLELKTVEKISSAHIAQTLTYMKLGGYKLGLVLNFNETTMLKGIKRLVL